VNELDQTHLEQVHAWAQRKVDEHDRRQRLRPLQDAVIEQMRHFSSAGYLDIMAESLAQSRKSIIALERSVEEFREKERTEDEEVRAVLVSARRRTAALRYWLEI
jgi:hypothetical protein